MSLRCHQLRLVSQLRLVAQLQLLLPSSVVLCGPLAKEVETRRGTTSFAMQRRALWFFERSLVARASTAGAS